MGISILQIKIFCVYLKELENDSKEKDEELRSDEYEELLKIVNQNELENLRMSKEDFKHLTIKDSSTKTTWIKAKIILKYEAVYPSEVISYLKMVSIKLIYLKFETKFLSLKILFRSSITLVQNYLN